MTWQPEVDELRRRQQLAREMGGIDKVRRQHEAGKLTVRERIDAILDRETFLEIGGLSGVAKYDSNGTLEIFTPSNFIFGRGQVNARPVIIGGDDYTVRAGSSEAAIPAKANMAEHLANELRIPLIRLVDGMGGGGSVKKIEILGRTYLPMLRGWEWIARNLSTVPTVSLGLGTIAGAGAARVVLSHYSIMVRGTSQMMIAGPPVVARLGEKVTKEELGGAELHARVGAIDDMVESEAEAFARARQFLSYLPPSVFDVPPRGERGDDPGRRDETLIEIIPRQRSKIYKARRIIESVVDAGSFFEMGRLYGRSLITGLARLDGWPIALLAEDTAFYGGGWTALASQKATRLIDLAGTFHLPIVHLVDCPGFVVGTEAEKAGTIRHGSRAFAAMVESDVPYCSVILRKVFGVAGGLHTNPARAQYRFAWPSADWGSMPLEGGIEAAYKAELDAAEDRAACLTAIEERLNWIRSPFRTAESFDIEEIIDPRDTRPRLCEFANLAAPLRRPGPSRVNYRP